MLGSTGVGKSSLANVLVGRSHKFDGGKFQKGCFKVKSGAEAVTQHTCADEAHWLGNMSYPEFTVIDTPGFGDNITAENRHIKNMVDRFKYEFKSIHVFVILFKQNDHRMTMSLWNMLNVFQSMFGPAFWSNVILEATHWSYSQRLTEIRTSSGLNEEQWTKQFNEKLKKDFDFTHDLPSVFIDTFRNQKNQHEVNMFYQNTEKLWQFALNKIDNPFYCRDVEVAMSSISNLQDEVSRLEDLIAQQKKEIEKENKTIHHLNSTIQQHVSNIVPSPAPTPAPVSNIPSSLISMGAAVGYSVCSFFTGVLVTAIIVTWLFNLSNYRKIDAVDEDEICSENSESENEAVEKRC